MAAPYASKSVGLVGRAGLAVVGAGAVTAGRKAIGAAASAGMATAKGAAAYTRALRSGTAAAMLSDGVDFADKAAVANWVRDNPDLSRTLHNRALQAAVAAGAGQITGDMAGRAVNNPLGSFLTKEAGSRSLEYLLHPSDDKKQN